MNDITNKTTDNSSEDPTAVSTIENKNPESTKRSFLKRRSIIALIGGVLLMTCIVLLFVISSLIPSKKNTTVTDSQHATKFASAQAVIDAATVGLSGKIAPESTVKDDYQAYGTPVYMVTTRKFDALPLKISGAGYVSDSEIAAANYSILDKFFSTNKFKKISSESGNGPLASKTTAHYLHFTTYESADVLCAIWHVDATSTSLNNHLASVGCASKKSYEEAAAKLDPFYQAYIKTTDKKSSSRLVLGDPVISSSHNGYESAVVYQEDPESVSDTNANESIAYFQGLYYKAAASKEWTYFGGVSGIPECSEFNTDILKKAFAGVSCYDLATQREIALGS